MKPRGAVVGAGQSWLWGPQRWLPGSRWEGFLVVAASGLKFIHPSQPELPRGPEGKEQDPEEELVEPQMVNRGCEPRGPFHVAFENVKHEMKRSSIFSLARCVRDVVLLAFCQHRDVPNEMTPEHF